MEGFARVIARSGEVSDVLGQSSFGQVRQVFGLSQKFSYININIDIFIFFCKV